MNWTALIFVGGGVFLLSLPDPSSMSDYLGLVLVLAGLQVGGVKIDLNKLLK